MVEDRAGVAPGRRPRPRSRSGSGSRSVALLAAVACALACATPKPEAAAVISAVDRYRRVDNAQKPAAAAEIEKVACSDPEVCETKRLCLESAKATSRALVLKAEVERGLADLEAGRLSKDDPKAKELQQKLDESARLLGEGYRAMPACDDKMLVLKRKYGI